MSKFAERYDVVIGVLATTLLLIFPGSLLFVKGGMNGVFLGMLLLAVAVWIKPLSDSKSLVWRRELTVYALAMFGLSLAILVSQLVNGSVDGHPHDATSRYWLAIPIFILLLRVRAQVFVALEVAFPLAAILGWWFAADRGYGVTLPSLDKIHFGDYLLLLGALSLFSLDWRGRDNLWLRLLKWGGFACGLTAALASGTRGALLAIPVFIAIYFYFRVSRLSPKMIFGGLMVGVAILSLAYFTNHTVQQRLGELRHDVAVYDQGNRDTSTGVRWQLYKAAVEVFVEHPLAGVGPQGFAQQMAGMEASGKITALTAELGRGEVHNDILAKAAGMGVLGLVAILALYLVPLRLFWQASLESRRTVRQAGIMGMTFVGGHMVFGLTVEFLALTMNAAFYGFGVAVFMAACYNPPSETSNSKAIPCSVS